MSRTRLTAPHPLRFAVLLPTIAVLSTVLQAAQAEEYLRLSLRNNPGYSEALLQLADVAHKRGNDLPVNPTKAKQLTNIRAAGSDENIQLTPPLKLSLEQALEFIDDDELVEITPQSIRLRKKLLAEGERRRDARQRAKEALN